MKNINKKNLPLILLIPITFLLSLNFRGGCSVCQLGTVDNRAISYSEFDDQVFIVSSSGRFRIYNFQGFNCDLTRDTLLYNGSLNAIEIKNPLQALICGDNGKIFRPNGLLYESWQNISSGTLENLNDIDFSDGIPVYIVGNNGTILKSTNFGQTFFPLNSGTTLDLTEVQCISGDSIRIAGDSSLSMFSTDRGNSWIQQIIPVEADNAFTTKIRAQHFINFNTGWAAGLYLIFKTTNAGLNWFTHFKQPRSYDNYTNSLFFYNKDSGIAVGNGGDIQFTTNGGTFWFYTPELQNFTTKNLNEFVYNSETGAAAIAGDSGILIHTDSVLIQPKLLSLTFFIEGFYDPGADEMAKDTAKVYLRSSVSPFTVADSSIAYIDSTGHGIFSFSDASNATSYFIVLRHRNSIETWSSSSVSFSSNSLTYDFTNSSSFAFGDNMIQVDSLPVQYAIYSGDVNQEGTVDVSDVIEVYNDAANFAGGYINTDLNGDNFTDITDVSIAFNNSSHFVSVISP